MCTVTYVPTGEQQYVLTHNRDENPERSPDRLHTGEIAGWQLIFPKEPQAGGTWIAGSNNDLTICILNGAFENHERTPPYRRSRGLVALDFFGYSSLSDFAEEYTFERIEPFTLLVCEGKKLHELRWDSKKVHVNELDAQKPHIWSSAPLYRPEIRRKREQWFDLWLQLNPVPRLENIMDFHQNAGEGNPRTDVIMKKSDNFRTVSITNVIRTPGELEMHYRDLITESIHEKSLPLARRQSNMKGGQVF